MSGIARPARSGALTVVIGLALISAAASAARAQHEGHEEHQSPPPAAGQTPHQHGEHGAGGIMGGHHIMPSSVDLNVPMNRSGSGTAWLPDSTPIYAWMRMRGSEMWMLHGAITPRYVDAGTRRGDSEFSAPNWFMAMYSRPLGSRDQIGLRAMVSLDYLTNGNDGYPLLFQTGETFRGEPLIDRQHPHDLFSELSVAYSRRIGADDSAFLYLAYPGEPALGPPTFMHRLIALDYPDSPLSHHWTDSTHIAFGVATAGVDLGRKVKLEGSVFTGREPDERRYDFDRARFDSHAGRVSWNPDRNNALQISHAFLKEPEAHEPGVNQHRTTASWVYNRPLGDDANFSTALVWGQNRSSEAGRTNAVYADLHLQSRADNYFARLEQVEKTGHELGLEGELEGRKFDIGALTVGYVRDLSRGTGIDIGVGGAVTVNSKPGALDAVYGGGTPVTWQVFLRLRPSRLRERGDSGGMMSQGMQDGD